MPKLLTVKSSEHVAILQKSVGHLINGEIDADCQKTKDIVQHNNPHSNHLYKGSSSKMFYTNCLFPGAYLKRIAHL
jgi:hypothetical protein